MLCEVRVYRASQVVQLTCMPYTTQTSEFGMRNIEGSHGYGCPPHSLALSVPVVVFFFFFTADISLR